MYWFNIVWLASKICFRISSAFVPSCETGTGGIPGYGCACVIKNFTIRLINSISSSPLTIDEVLRSMMFCIVSISIPYTV